MSQPTMQRETVTYQVPAMSCASCVIRINATLRQQHGVSGVRINLPTKTVQFSYRPDQTTLTPIIEALAGVGYPVTTSN